VNHVYVVRGPMGNVCVKQAPPYVRAAGAQWPLSPERISFEWRALLEHGRHATQLVPEPLHYDPERKLMVLEYLDGYDIVRDGLTAGVTYPHFAEKIGGYLAVTLFYTSDFAMPSGRKRAMVSEFEGNAPMCDIMENMVFTEIFMPHSRNQWTRPWLDKPVEEIQHDVLVKLAAAKLKLSYMTCKQALLHGDLHTGSIMTTDSEIRVIDHEFACFGPIAYDVGVLLAHLLISYFARDGLEPDPARRESFQAWALGAVKMTWETFRRRFTELWRTTETGDAYHGPLFSGEDERAALEETREEFMGRLLIDAVQFCAAEILRRVIGFASVSDFTTIGDESARAACERRGLTFARKILADGYRDSDISALTDLAERVRVEAALRVAGKE
jgi:5-methylthioribose kinase